MAKLNAAIVAAPNTVDYVYGSERRASIAERTNLLPEVVTPEAALASPEILADTEAIFTTWSFPALTPAHLEKMPRLKIVLYGAGSVQYFARPLLERGIALVSGWRINGISVAEFTVAQIILGAKGFFRNAREYDGSPEGHRDAFRGAGAYGETVALLGVGAVGSRVIEMLRPIQVKVIVFDPFLSAERAREMGVEKVETLAEAFERAYVVSNHLANNPATVGLIDKDVLAKLRPNATFINTGRGATVDEKALVDLCARRPDLTALLDVTDPEPPGAGSPLTKLPNVVLTSHIAGAINDEVHRLADLCLYEFDRFAAGRPLEHAVTLEDLARLA